MRGSLRGRLPLLLGAVLVLTLLGHVTGVAPWLPSSEHCGAGAGEEQLTAEEDGTGVGLDARGKARDPKGASESAAPTWPAPVDLDSVDRLLDLHGIVVQADGTPIPGALIDGFEPIWQRGSLLASDLWDTERSVYGTQSARDGTFSWRLERGTQVSLRISAAGFATIVRTACQPGERLRVVLHPGVRLELVAKDPDGVPVPDVEVKLSGRGAVRGAAFVARGVCDAEGVCRLEGLPAGGSAHIEAKAGALGGWADRWESFELPEEGTLRREFIVSPGRVVRGRVTDKATGLAIPGARVGMGWTFFKEVRTDADGHYALGGWTGDGYHEIHVLASGYARKARPVAQESTIDLALERGFTVRGRLLAQGRPSASAQVAAIGYESGDSLTMSTAAGMSHSDGTFELSDLSPGRAHTLVVMAPGRGRLVTRFEAPPAGVSVQNLGDIELPPALRVSGRVLDAEGQPLPRTGVTITGPLTQDGDGSNYGREEERITDDLGRYTFGELAPGRYLLTAGAHNSLQVTRELELTAHQDGVELRFEPRRELIVRTVDPRGEAVTGVTIYASPWGAEDSFGQTGREGRVTLQLPMHVRWVDVTVFGNEGGKPFLQPDPQRVAAEAGEHEIVLADAAIVKGTLLDAAGAPIPEGRVEARRADRLLASSETDAQGRFEFGVAPGGPVDLVFRGDVWRDDPENGGRGSVRMPLTAERPRTPVPAQDVVLRATAVPAAIELTVRVLLPDGKPARGFEVLLDPAPRGTPGRVKTDAEGRVRFRGLTDQPVTLAVKPPPARASDLAPLRESNVRPARRTVTLELATPLLLEGSVVDAKGVPVEGASVMVNRNFGLGMPETKTAADGRFTLALPPTLKERVEVWAAAKRADGAFLYADISGVDPRAGPLRVEVKPHRGW